MENEEKIKCPKCGEICSKIVNTLPDGELKWIYVCPVHKIGQVKDIGGGK